MLAYKNKFHFEFICHYIDELADFRQDFPDGVCHYSYDSKEYLEIYHQFDLVVGPRVHGIGIAASMGIQGISIQHDARADTCHGFMADVIRSSADINDALKVFDAKIKKISAGDGRELLLEKQTVFDKYVELLKPRLKNL